MTEDRYILEVVVDESPINPWDDYSHASQIAHWHRRGFFGEDIRTHRLEWRQLHEKKHDLILPLYLYEHSGQTISLTPFSDPWDSGQVGWVWMSKKDLEGLMGPLSSKSWKRVGRRVAAQEIKELDQYLRGECWGWQIKEGDKVIDWCWGYYEKSYCLTEGEVALKGMQESQFLLDLQADEPPKTTPRTGGLK